MDLVYTMQTRSKGARKLLLNPAPGELRWRHVDGKERMPTTADYMAVQEAPEKDEDALSKEFRSKDDRKADVNKARQETEDAKVEVEKTSQENEMVLPQEWTRWPPDRNIG